MIELFTALGAGVVGLLASVVFSGLLAGIVSYGVVETFLKPELHKQVAVDLFERPVSKALGTPDGRYFFEAIFGPRYDGFLPYRGGDRPPMADYMDFLMGRAKNGALIPSLLGLPKRSAY